MYVVYLRNEGLAPSTIHAYISAIGYVHRISGHPDPSSATLMSKALMGAKRSQAHSQNKQLLPVTKVVLKRVVKAIPFVVDCQYQAKMYHAIFLLAYFACLHPGEIVVSTTGSHTLKFKQVQLRHQKHRDTYVITLTSYKHSKGHQANLVLNPDTRHTATCPVRALKSYIRCRG